jgi:hypothetical protein
MQECVDLRAAAKKPSTATALFAAFKHGLVETLGELVEFNEPVGEAGIVTAWIIDRASAYRHRPLT